MKPVASISLGPTAHAVLEYLIGHTEAEDTLTGIAEWWLMEQQIQRAISQVRQALAELVSRKLVVERQAKDGRTFYRLNRRQMGTAKRLVRERRGD